MSGRAEQFDDGLKIEAARKSRKELQAYLKSQKQPATGTTDALRQCYLESRSIGSVAVVPCASAAASVAENSADTKPSAKKVASMQGKRLKKYRPTCSRKVQERIARARTQRLFLVEPPTKPAGNEIDMIRECTVLGSTGNIYKVIIGPLVQCTCPDHQQGNICKHILFVMLKVVGLPENSPLLYQAALVSGELKNIFELLDKRMAQVGRTNGGGVMANSRVRKAYQDLTSPAKPKQEEDFKDNDEQEKTLTGAARQPTEGGECPICFDPLLPAGSNQRKEQIVFCKAMCGYNFHKVCMSTWKTQSSTCPNCRAEWLENDESFAARAAVSSPEGYTNLGRLQGQSTARDTSSYSEWFGKKKRRRF